MNKIRMLRGQKKGMTVRELARLAEVNESTVSALERGIRKAQWATLSKLAAVLGVETKELEEFLDEGAPDRGRIRHPD